MLASKKTLVYINEGTTGQQAGETTRAHAHGQTSDLPDRTAVQSPGPIKQSCFSTKHAAMSKLTAKDAFAAQFQQGVFAKCFCQSKTICHKTASSFQFSKCDDCGANYATLESKHLAKESEFTTDDAKAVAKAKADATAKAAAKGMQGKGSGGGSGPITQEAYPSGLDATIKKAFEEVVYPTYENDPEPFDEAVDEIGDVMKHETLQMVSDKYKALTPMSMARKNLKGSFKDKNGDSTAMVEALIQIKDTADGEDPTNPTAV